MNTLDLLLLAVSLSMDAFAVSICKGLSLGKINWRHMVLAGLWFGGFQALMPTIGYGLGSFFADMIDAYDHWVTFILLSAIGLNMIKESFEDEEHCDASMSPYTMLMLAIATSIDARRPVIDMELTVFSIDTNAHGVTPPLKFNQSTYILYYTGF